MGNGQPVECWPQLEVQSHLSGCCVHLLATSDVFAIVVGSDGAIVPTILVTIDEYTYARVLIYLSVQYPM